MFFIRRQALGSCDVLRDWACAEGWSLLRPCPELAGWALSLRSPLNPRPQCWGGAFHKTLLCLGPRDLPRAPRWPLHGDWSGPQRCLLDHTSHRGGCLEAATAWLPTEPAAAPGQPAFCAAAAWQEPKPRPRRG